MNDLTLGPSGPRVNPRKITPAEWRKVVPHPAAREALRVLERWLWNTNSRPWPGYRELATEAGVGNKVAWTLVRRMVGAGLLEFTGGYFPVTGKRWPMRARLRYQPRVEIVHPNQIEAWSKNYSWGRKKGSRRPESLPFIELRDATTLENYSVSPSFTGSNGSTDPMNGSESKVAFPDSLKIPDTTANRVNVLLTHIHKPEVCMRVKENPGAPDAELDAVIKQLDAVPRSSKKGDFFRGPYKVQSVDRSADISPPGVRMPSPATDEMAAMVLWTAYKDAYLLLAGKKYGNWRVKMENVHRQRWYKTALAAWKLIQDDGRVHPLIWAKWFMQFSTTVSKSNKILPFTAVFSPKTITKWLGLCWHQLKPNGRLLFMLDQKEQVLRRRESMYLNVGALKPGDLMPDHWLVIRMECCTWYRDLRRQEIADGHLDPNDCWRAITEDDREVERQKFYAANPSYEFGEF